MAKTKTGIPINLKDIRRLERTFSKSLKFKNMGDLPQIVERSQELLLAILVNRGAEPFRIDDPSEKAVCAVGIQSFNLARTTTVSISSGYPIQSLIPLRALYERVSVGVSFYSDPKLAARYLDKKIKAKEMRFATSMKTNVQTADCL